MAQWQFGEPYKREYPFSQVKVYKGHPDEGGVLVKIIPPCDLKLNTMSKREASNEWAKKGYLKLRKEQEETLTSININDDVGIQVR